MRNVVAIIAHKDYNKYLHEAIASCFNQTYKTDVCIVDDGSKESIEPIIQQFDQYKDRIHFLQNDKNYGPSYSRNRAIKYCYDKYDAFMILDADDIMCEKKVEKMIPYLKDIVGIVYGDYTIFDESLNIYREEYKHSYDYLLLQKNCIIHSGSLISKEALNYARLNENEWYKNDMRTCEDYDLWLRICQEFIGYHVPERLTIVREHSQNSTNTVSPNQWAEDLKKVAR